MDEDWGLRPDGSGVDWRANAEENVWGPADGEDFWAAPSRKTECVENERSHRSWAELVKADRERNSFYLLCCLDFSGKEHLFTKEAGT